MLALLSLMLAFCEANERETSNVAKTNTNLPEKFKEDHAGCSVVVSETSFSLVCLHNL